jgi:hypothetical protein
MTCPLESRMIEYKARELAEERWAMPSARVLTLRAGPVSAVPAVPVSPAIAGPSENFVSLTRNPKLRPPVRFEPTPKKPGDIVL